MGYREDSKREKNKICKIWSKCNGSMIGSRKEKPVGNSPN